jgi:hypothetical protein
LVSEGRDPKSNSGRQQAAAHAAMIAVASHRRSPAIWGKMADHSHIKLRSSSGKAVAGCDDIHRAELCVLV